MSGSNPPGDPHPDIFSLGQRQVVPAGAHLTMGVPDATAVRPSGGRRARRSPILGYLPYIAGIAVVAVVAAVVCLEFFSRGGPALPSNVEVLREAVKTDNNAT